jgi:hypothetical protein
VSAGRVGRPMGCPEPVLREVVALSMQGVRLADIAAELNRRQVPTPSGGAARWYASHVSRVLRTKTVSELREAMTSANEPKAGASPARPDLSERR